MEKKRSVGVTVIGVVDLLFGTLLLIWGIGSALVMFFDRAYIGILSCIPLLIISLGFIQAGRLIYKLNVKAIKRNIFISIIGILFVLIFVFAMRNWTDGSLLEIIFNSGLYSLVILILFVYFVWSIVYLTRPKVKEQFR